MFFASLLPVPKISKIYYLNRLTINLNRLKYISRTNIIYHEKLIFKGKMP